MKRQLLKLLSRLLLAVSRTLGEYRTWRILHALAELDPDHVRRLCEYVFKAELPSRYLSKEFLAYWLDDETVTHVMRRHAALQSSPFYSLRVFHEVRQLCLVHNHLPSRVLEIGPGMHLGVLFCFAACGCERVAGVDIEPIREQDAGFYATLRDCLAVAAGFNWWRGYAAFNQHPELSYPEFWDNVRCEDLLSRIEYKSPCPSHELPFENDSFDLVYSVTAFEHFSSPEQTAEEIRRVLKPGGLTVHEIDMRHHVDMRYHQPEDALSFLAWDDKQHDFVSERYGNGRGLEGLLAGNWGTEVYCNRLRLSDITALFERHGLRLLQVEPLEIFDPAKIDRGSFTERFRSKTLEDLSVLVARIVAEKR